MSARVLEFEGSDGTGKTTAMNYFCDQLEKHDKKVLRTREIGNPHVPFCARLRSLVLDPNQQLDGRTMELLFAAGRMENQKFYESVKDQYDFIVSDRGWLCHPSYGDHNATPEFTEEFWYGLMSRYTKLPDEIFLFNADPKIALARRTRRGETVDAIEAKGQEFQEKVIQSYMEHAYKLYMVNHEDKYVGIHVIDANRSLEAVKTDMEQLAEALCSR